LEVDGRMARTASFFDKLNPILFTKDTFNSWTRSICLSSLWLHLNSCNIQMSDYNFTSVASEKNASSLTLLNTARPLQRNRPVYTIRPLQRNRPVYTTESLVELLNQEFFFTCAKPMKNNSSLFISKSGNTFSCPWSLIHRL
jgi:hypothetical protein